MSDKIIIPFEDKKISEVDTGGVFTQMGFENLRKLLEPACDIDEDERITGLVITKDCIRIRIDRINSLKNP